MTTTQASEQALKDAWVRHAERLPDQPRRDRQAGALSQLEPRLQVEIVRINEDAVMIKDGEERLGRMRR